MQHDKYFVMYAPCLIAGTWIRASLFSASGISEYVPSALYFVYLWEISSASLREESCARDLWRNECKRALSTGND